MEDVPNVWKALEITKYLEQRWEKLHLACNEDIWLLLTIHQLSIFAFQMFNVIKVKD